MSNLSKAQSARLGVFITVGVFLLLVFIAVPVGFSLRDKTTTYYAVFEGESLSGLEQSAIVKYNGIPIGKVEELNYDPSNIDQVRVTLSIEDDFPMKTDMYAQTGMMGITGLMYLEVMGGTNEAEIMEPKSEIPTRRSTMSVLTGNAEDIVAKVELLLNHLNVISHPDSLRSIKQIFDNVAIITQDTRMFLDEVRPGIHDMAGSMQSVLSRVDSISNDIHLLTSDLSDGLSQGQFAQILTSVDSTSIALQDLSTTLGLTIRQSREDITVALENIREASENANELTKILSENPSLLIRGEQQRERIIR